MGAVYITARVFYMPLFSAFLLKEQPPFPCGCVLLPIPGNKLISRMLALAW